MTEDPEQVPQEAAEPQLQKMKSSLTTMLANTDETRGFHDIFAAVPRVPKGEPESAPIETLPVPWGVDFGIQVCVIALQAIVIAYLWSVLISIVATVADVLGGSCEQDSWKIPSDEACSQLFRNALLFGIEWRCYRDKPTAMIQDDFEKICGEPWTMIIGLVIFVGYAVYSVYNSVGKIPVKVHFHPDFFTVESWSGKNFEGTFYADVTGARNGLTGLSVSTKAKFRLQAGGEDENDKNKKGKTLHIEGNKVLKVISGHGVAQKTFAAAFSKYLKVPVVGGDASVTAVQSSEKSILEGRVKDILNARKGDANTQAVRMPKTADLITTLVIVVIMVLVVWYIIATISTLIGWAINKAQNKCLDPKRPDEDMCAVWRIFVPIDVPIVNASNYINLILVIVGIVFYPTYIIAEMEMEYRFHNKTLMQEVRFAGLECQTNKMVFSDDVVSMEKINGSLEKYIKVGVRTHYTIKGGISQAFTISAMFMSKDVKMTLVDPSCAACCGQTQKATDHTENLVSSLREFKPDLQIEGNS
jgi:hypothetical protein